MAHDHPTSAVGERPLSAPARARAGGAHGARRQEQMRSCSRAACRWPASSSLSYRYATRQVWLLDLSPQPDPSLYDLCPHHADALVVPRGWERVDERKPAQPVVEPSAAEIAARHEAERRERSEAPAGSRGQERGNRYEELSRDLPKLAAELARTRPGAGAQAEAPAQSPPESQPSHGCAVEGRRAADPLPTRDLAPLPVEGPGSGPHVHVQARADDEAVVVPLHLAGLRRRGTPPGQE